QEGSRDTCQLSGARLNWYSLAYAFHPRASMIHRPRPHSLRRLHPGSPLISLVLLATFLGVAFLISAGITQGWDRSFSLLVHVARPPGLVRFMAGATILGTRDFAAPVIMGVLGLLITRRQYGPALGFALLAVGGGGPAELVKLFVERARPQLWHG